MIDEEFRAAYRALEARMKAQAEADGDVYLPNLEPLRPVEYVVICQEPSLGKWAHSENGKVDVGLAKSNVDAGFRNFISSIGDWILHFCIRQYLCEPEQRYHITDLSKGAMLVKDADNARTQRYDRWYELLRDELNLVAKPEVGIVPVGGEVNTYLKRQERAFPRPFTRYFEKVTHYAAWEWKLVKDIDGREERFEEFKGSVSMENLRATAEEILAASAVPAIFRDKAIASLAKGQLSESQQMLIFIYKSAFEEMRSSSRTG